MVLRQILQTETAELHGLLDALASEQGWFADLGRYGGWLRGMHAFHTQVSQELSAIDLHEQFDEQRTERLALDMLDLGIEPLPRRPRIAGLLPDSRAALGVLYVTEGATLGARVLLKRAEALGCSERHGARFLAAEARGFASWHAVLEQLESAKFDESEVSRLANASVRTFKLAVECLDRVHSE